MIRDFRNPSELEGGGRTITRRSLLLAAGGVAATAFVGASVLDPEPASAWGGYANGQIPLDQLTSVDGHRFRNDAAVAMVALRAAYRGALGRTLILNDGYRDLAGQWRAWNDYLNGGNLAVYPGTSNHGWAIAADFGGEVYSSSASAGHRWLQANALAFGWSWTGRYFSRIENWHWEYNGSYTGTTPTPEDNPDFDIHRRNNNMASLYYTTVNGVTTFALAGDGVGNAAWLETTDQALANQLAGQHGNAAFLTQGSFNQWKSWYLGQ
nr:M15 family metallopeptidase [Microbacterium sp. Be9]